MNDRLHGSVRENGASVVIPSLDFDQASPYALPAALYFIPIAMPPIKGDVVVCTGSGTGSSVGYPGEAAYQQGDQTRLQDDAGEE